MSPTQTETPTTTPTAKKKTTKKKKTTITTTTTKKTAASAAEAEIIEKIYAPKILAIIDQHNPTISKLVSIYNEENDCNVSSQTVSKWLKHLGWKYERVPTWVGLPVETSFDPDTEPDNPAFGKNVPIGPDATRGFNPAEPVVV